MISKESGFSIELDRDSLVSTAYAMAGLCLCFIVSAAMLVAHFQAYWQLVFPGFLPCVVAFFVVCSIGLIWAAARAFRNRSFLVECQNQSFAGKGDSLVFLDLYSIQVNHLLNWELVDLFLRNSRYTYILLEHDGTVETTERAKIYEQSLLKDWVKDRTNTVFIATTLFNERPDFIYEKLVQFLAANNAVQRQRLSFPLLSGQTCVRRDLKQAREQR